MLPRHVITAANPVAAACRATLGSVLCLTLIVFIAKTAAAGEAKTPKPAPKVKMTQGAFASGGKKIKLEWFRPQGDGPHPAVLLVHESAGMNVFPATVFRHYADILAKEGYVVLLVHYFNRTGHEDVDPKKEDELRKHFPAWRDTLRDAVKLLSREEGVNPKRIGILGLSLGSYLSMSLAMDKELGVAAVANLFGGLPDELWKDLKHLPPTLMIGGAKDDLVHANKCYAISGWCAAKNVPCVCHVFEDQEHLFAADVKKHFNIFNPLQTLQKSKDIQETQRLIITFFAEHLRKEMKAGQGK
jgi:dienelactone hydrolase